MASLPAVDPASHLNRFGLATFRPGQQEVIGSVLAGDDCLCIMPTGGGKSLCYQLPAVARDGLVLVVSPLIALMKDQVDALQSLGIDATYINSSLTLDEQRQRLAALREGQYDLVYIAPERLRNHRFLEAIETTAIQLLAIDEAHCISEWGHDFRPDYARLARFRQRLRSPQTIALTATATPAVQQDIVQSLQLQSPRTFVTGFSRPNLVFEVTPASNGAEKDERLQSFLEANPGAGIIYASTRKRCEELVDTLQSQIDRPVGVYHGGMEPDQRRAVQEAFMRDRLAIVVATNAFGMGIDKPDLRFVVHYNMPGSLEAYYQEAGRAGRDGQPARCLLLFTYQDRYVQEFFIESAYPPAEVVSKVWHFLRRQETDPIEITLKDLKEKLGLTISAEGVGTCERLLEKSGALERLDSQENRASIRLDSDLPTAVDLLPREARTQRRVLRAAERLVSSRRFERVYFPLRALMDQAELSREALTRALRELNKLDWFDYVPPFRGRAVHLLRPEATFEELDIDFESLEQRRAAEYDKLEQVVRYASNRSCRQLTILDYFGDASRRSCEQCDNCVRHGRRRTHTVPEATVPPPRDDRGAEAAARVVRMALSGVARTERRFGKQTVAQMLCGSRSSKLAKWRLDQLSTFGLLRDFRQSDVIELLDRVQQCGLIEQVEEARFRPTLQLTQMGGRVMRSEQEVPQWLELPSGIATSLFGVGAQLAKPLPPDDTPAQAPSHRPASTPPPPGRSVDFSPHGSDRNVDFSPHGSSPNRTGETLAACESVAFAEANETGDETLSLGPVDARVAERLDLAGWLEPPAAAQPPDARPSYYWTWRLLSCGISAEECSRARGIDRSQVLADLLRAVEEGYQVRLQWLLSPDQCHQLQTALFHASSDLLAQLRRQHATDCSRLLLELAIKLSAADDATPCSTDS